MAQKIADPESRKISEYSEAPDDDNDRRSQWLVKLYFALEQIDKVQQVIEKTQGTSLRNYLQAWIHY
ncbi:MAG: hypothetical protein RMY34_06185 [Aulosira sp. DedQUE10]|nr:hypothetical protein [Aulosira sp. DedQUE10]